MKPNRISCCVPFCRRTVAADRIAPSDEWICGTHWPQVPKKVRAFKIKAARAFEKTIEAYDTINHEGAECVASLRTVSSELKARSYAAWLHRAKAQRRCARAWERCKRRAIESGMGI
ncbi:MAG: hypothetical protein ACREB5_09560 [Sphingomonadaceae bacterium]